MSAIERMKISGIRSFSHTDSQIIYFFAPLTLIVGYNGSGKTTIIECLRYATSGSSPPGTKAAGGAFVHDPKLTSEKEILAQVKLLIKTAAQDKAVITRSLQLSVKKTGVSVKTLDTTILTVRHDERESLSHKVDAANGLIPNLLGVSRAILDNVIFCHQDEALWPMSEPSKLKIKFDEIFDAKKYTDAIESLNKLRKSHKDILKQDKIHEDHNRKDKDMADKSERKTFVLKDEIEELSKQVEEIDAEMKSIKEKIEQKERVYQAAKSLVNDLSNKTQQAEIFKHTLESLQGTFDELKESDEWLETTLNQHSERMQELDELGQRYSEDYTKVKLSLDKNSQNMALKQKDQGQHLAQRKSYESQLQSRIVLVKEAARSHSFRGYDGDLEDYQVQEFLKRIQKLLQDKDRELERIIKATNDDLQKSQSVLTLLEGRQSALRQEKANANQVIEANAKKSRARQNDMDNIKMDEGAKTALEASLKDVQEHLRSITTNFENADWDTQIKEQKDKLLALESENQRLQDLLFEGHQVAKVRAALEYAKKEAKKAQQSLDTMKSAHNSELSKVLGANWLPDNVEREFSVVCDQVDNSVAEAKKQQEGAERDLRDNGFKLQTAISSKKRKTEEMQSCEAAVLESVKDNDGQPISSIDSYLTEVQEIETGRAEIRTELGNMDHVRNFYIGGISSIRDKNCCRLCDRTFTDKHEQSNAVKKLQAKVDKLIKVEHEEELKRLEADLRAAEAARPQYESYRRLHDTEIPALESEIKSLETQKTKLVSICEAKDQKMNEETQAKRDVDALSSTVRNIASYQAQITNHQEEISSLSSQRSLSGGALTIEEIQEKSTSCREQIQSLKSKIEKLTSTKDAAKAEIAKSENESGALAGKLNSAQYLLENKRTLQISIDELRDDTSQQREVILRIGRDLEDIDPQRATAQAQHDAARRRGQEKQREVQSEKDKLAQTVNQFKLLNEAINKYIDDDGPGQLAACERAIHILEQEKARLDSEMTQITQDANELKNRTQSSKDTQRSIMDNIRFRKTQRELEVVMREISEMQGRNAVEEARIYGKELQILNDKHQVLFAQRGPLYGQIHAKDKELEGLLDEWNIMYKDAGDKYRKSHVKVETTKAAIEDMGKCSLALENAIMKFHTLKMEEINSIAAELWRSTYQGSDVDTIMIRSENETASANATKRNYNYRLVMVKQDAEMDMRGRCSAGQRVLASIIIRLALAECFGVNCGVIALDEPTTNLDQDNIRALAQSLHAIIKARKHQSNFQLIIITHDEEFLKEMQCSEFCDHYWRVSRDSNQCSVIEKQSLADLGM